MMIFVKELEKSYWVSLYKDYLGSSGVIDWFWDNIFLFSSIDLLRVYYIIFLILIFIFNVD